MVTEINGEKVVVVHTLNGNIVVSQQAVEKAKSQKKKQWREFSSFFYPTHTIEKDMNSNLPAHLAYHLHRTFQGGGYVAFSSFVSIEAKSEADVFTVTSQHARYTGSINRMLKKLWSEDEDRKDVQAQMNAELMALHKDWTVVVKLAGERQPLAYDFVYDPDGYRLSIAPSNGSTDPRDYPNKVQTTSEMVQFLSAHLHTNFAVMDIGATLKSLPLSKVMLMLLDRTGFRFNEFRVAVDDPEEWDYVNAQADEELARAFSTSRP